MNKENSTVLHITPHLGGGVGTVVLNYVTKAKDNPHFLHKVACLDYANEHAIDVAQNIELSLVDRMASKNQELLAMVAEADIVLIHWWNHPLLFDFLVRQTLLPSRVLLWSHISGFHPPYVFTNKILKYPDLFVFTTPISYEVKEVINCSDKLKRKLRVVWSTGGVDHVKSVKHNQHSGFNVGYIGTVDYAKIHPNFLTLCNNIKIPNVKFIVCGGSSEKELRREAEDMGIADKFDFTGLVSDITRYLSIFDVFGYPLAPYHYGTCDQSLAESMAAGVVPVVLPNRMESYMIQDGITGIVAKDEKGYVEAIQGLFTNNELRDILSRNTKEYAIQTFSVDKMIREWERIFEELLELPKTPKKWSVEKNSSDILPTDVFLEALGDYGACFKDYCIARTDEEKLRAVNKITDLAESEIWNADTRGTVHHYRYFFPDDEVLSFWSQLMRKAR